jgi:hypothetical protein
MLIRASIMVNGKQVQNQEKECLSILIRIFIQVTGWMERSTAKEPMYSMLQE